MAGPGAETSRGSSAPAPKTPTGTAGLGTAGPARRGKAFVPIAVEDLVGFVSKFGNVGSDSFAALAADAWLSKAEGCTFIRLLGIGDGKQRISADGTTSSGENLPAGSVKNAGFVVGSRLTGSSGLLQSNPFAVDGGLPGRAYFLGAFMSESAGSTYFSDANLQGTALPTAAVGTVTLDAVGISNFYDTVVRVTDTTGTEKRYILKNQPASDPATTVDLDPGGGVVTHVVVGIQGLTYATAAVQLINAINGATGHAGTITATNSGAGVLALTQIVKGTYGNRPIITQNQYVDAGAQDWATYGIGSESGFAAGTYPNRAVPILRGILFAASGVLPAMSSSYTGNESTASIGATVGSFNNKQDGGATVGSVNINSGKEMFVMLLNGHEGTPEYPNVLTASFRATTVDRHNNNIFLTNVFNTDPTKIRQAGHYLYSYFDIPQSLAIVTGSGAVVDGTEKEKFNGDKLLDCAFLLTSSIPRNASDSAGSLKVPNFENFSDRYQAAKTPTFISQYIDRQQFDLFKFHSVDDGVFGNDQIKITIQNLKPQQDDDSYGSFDVVIRKWDNVDIRLAPVSGSEEFLNCNLNPQSENYIARVIGDQNYYYNFDSSIDRQRFVLDGRYENNSRFVRVEMAKAVEDQTLPKYILPVGFRGFGHLVTSGSSIMSCPQHPLSDGSVIDKDTEWANKIVEPPIPYRVRLSSQERTFGIPSGHLVLNGELCWGVQTSRFHTVDAPNSDLNPNNSIKSYSKYYPSFTSTRVPAFVSDNVGTASYDGTVYDVDQYNSNKFSLENILIHTKSKLERVVDNEQWEYARYSRNRTHRPLIDKTLRLKSGVRFFDVKKDLLTSNQDQVNPYLKYTCILQGGFDGVNIFSRENTQFANLAAYYEMRGINQGRKTGPVTAAYLKALHMFGDKSEVDIKLLALPGIRVEAITNQAIETAENRFDTFYVMDIEEATDSGDVVTADSDVPSPSQTAERFRSRDLGSSFAAAYFPDVEMMVPGSSTKSFFAPPSISVLRVYAEQQAQGSILAPAGFERGLIPDQSDGTAIQTKILISNTDEKEVINDLYSVAINPIVAGDDGLVLFGQRTTLSNADSLMQRISIRRMVIDIRRSVRALARNILFEQNQEKVLSDFREQIEPVLKSMILRGGISRYKVVVDETTTSQADIEANIVRGHVFMQPNKSEEIIQVDFVT